MPKLQTKEETHRLLSQMPLFKERAVERVPALASPSAIYGQILVDDGAWIVDAEPFVMERVRRMFNYGKSGNKGEYTHSVVHLRKTNDSARDLVWLMERYGFRVEDPLLDDL